jgi:hypothetical protein
VHACWLLRHLYKSQSVQEFWSGYTYDVEVVLREGVLGVRQAGVLQHQGRERSPLDARLDVGSGEG